MAQDVSSTHQPPITQNMAPQCLSSLPPEILSQITNHLSYASHLALSLTCREFYHKVDSPRQPYSPLNPSGAKVTPYTMADLLEIEKWLEYSQSKLDSKHRPLHLDPRDLFACSVCLRLRCGARFLYPMKQNDTLYIYVYEGYTDYKYARDRDINYRQCIPCRVSKKKYYNGMRFEVMWRRKLILIACSACGNFSQEDATWEGIVLCGVCRGK